MRRESEAIEIRVCGLHLALGGEQRASTNKMTDGEEGQAEN